MDQEEKFIEEKCGRRTPFQVPNGYFDSFAEQLIQNLPEREPATTAKVVPLKPTRWQRYRVGIAAAACACVVVLSLGSHLTGRESNVHRHEVAAGTQQSAAAYSSAEAMADYAMMDSEDMYALMADADN